MAPQLRLKCRNRLRQISNHRKLARTHAIQLCRINFEVHDLGMRCKSRGFSGHAIIQPRAKYHAADRSRAAPYWRRAFRACPPCPGNKAPPAELHPVRGRSQMSEHAELSSSCRSSGIAPDNFAPAPINATGFDDCCNRATDRVGESAFGFCICRPRVRRELHRAGEFLLRLQQVGRDVDHRPVPAARFAPSKTPRQSLRESHRCVRTSRLHLVSERVTPKTSVS